MSEVDIEAGQMIKTKRKALRMTQTQLGERVGLATNTICQYEAGKRQMDLLMFFKICHTLNISNEEIEKNLDACLKKYYK